MVFKQESGVNGSSDVVPGQGMLVFGLGLGLVTGGDRCARDAARQNRQKCLCL